MMRPTVNTRAGYLDEQEVLAILRRRCAESSQRAVADEIGVSRITINYVLNGRIPITPGLARALGYVRERVTWFRPATPEELDVD